MGYIDFEKFMKLPSSLLRYVTAVRAADSLKQLRREVFFVKDENYKKKLNSNIRELEAFFDE